MQKKIVTGLVIALCSAATMSHIALAQAPKPKTKQAPGTIGTKQLAGTEGQIGTTYTFEVKDAIPRFNFTLLSAMYTVDNVPRLEGSYAPGKDEKLLVLRYQIHNPNKEDISIAAEGFALAHFQAVASDNKTFNCELTPVALNEGSRKPGKPYPNADLVLKPGQKSEVLVAAIRVPAVASVPKLIIQRGRVGTNEQVVRFDLKGKVKPLPAPFADPADATGATALSTIPAKIGDKCLGIRSDFEVTSFAYTGETIGDIAPDEGGKLLVVGVTGTFKNGSRGGVIGGGDTFSGYYTDASGEKVTGDEANLTILRATRPAPFDGEEHEYGEKYTLRMIFRVPSGVSPKTVVLQNNSSDDGGGELVSRSYIFDLSAVK